MLEMDVQAHLEIQLQLMKAQGFCSKSESKQMCMAVVPFDHLGTLLAHVQQAEWASLQGPGMGKKILVA